MAGLRIDARAQPGKAGNENKTKADKTLTLCIRVINLVLVVMQKQIAAE